MNNITRMTKYTGVDISFGFGSDIEPMDGKFRVGKRGIDKNCTLEQVMTLAHEVNANIIIKGGKNAKWYLKSIDTDMIPTAIEKQEWRDTSRCIMWVIQWD